MSADQPSALACWAAEYLNRVVPDHWGPPVLPGDDTPARRAATAGRLDPAEHHVTVLTDIDLHGTDYGYGGDLVPDPHAQVWIEIGDHDGGGLIELEDHDIEQLVEEAIAAKTRWQQRQAEQHAEF